MKDKTRSLLALVGLVLLVSATSQWWAGRAERSVGAQVAALAQPGDIRMLSSETCAICRTARAWFTEHKVAFSECIIERDAACRTAFESSRSPGTPLIVVRGQGLVGFSPEGVQRALAAKT
jgi:glutaredoxin